MALNINLNNAFKNQKDIISPVDSNIIINKKNTDDTIYSDLKLDLECGQITEYPINATINNNDLLKLTNSQSVINSLKNILNSVKGSRLLNPEIETNLNSYLFLPLSSDIAYFIGDDLRFLIPLYEPRITVKSISVIPNYSDDSYFISLLVTIPSLNDKTVSLNSVLNIDGFS